MAALKKVLYADDATEWRHKAKLYFEKRYVRYKIEQDADAAVKSILEFDPDLIILDELDLMCFDVMARVPNHQNKVVIYTGYAPILKKADEMGISNYRKEAGSSKKTLDTILRNHLGINPKVRPS